MSKREFTPMILSTKEELRLALKNGDIKMSKYNLLKPKEKLFVEMIVFGGYTAEEAVKVLRPKIKNAKAAGNRMLAHPNVAEVMEELTQNKDRKFMAEISNVRELALRKLTYIMTSTGDDALAAACAKTILDKAEKAIGGRDKVKDEQISGIQFNIQVSGNPSPTGDRLKADGVVLDGEIEVPESAMIFEPLEPIAGDKEEESFDIKTESEEGGYALVYESIDNYTTPDAIDSLDDEEFE